MENETFTQHAQREATQELALRISQGTTDHALLIGAVSVRLMDCYLSDTENPDPYAFLLARQWARREVIHHLAKPAWGIICK